MISKNYIYSLLTITILAISIVACGGSETTPPTIPAQEEVLEEEPQPEVSNEEADEKVADGMRTFVILPDESSASYLVDEEFFEDALGKLGINAGNNDVVGSTQAIAGQFQVNPNDITNAIGENSFTVDMRTLKTDQEQRDNYILDRGPAFNSFPEATFSATELSGLTGNYVEGEEVQFQLSGILTVHKVPVPVTFEVTATLEGDTLTGVAETRLLMSSFDIEPPDFARTLTVADEFGILVEFTAKET